MVVVHLFSTLVDLRSHPTSFSQYLNYALDMTAKAGFSSLPYCTRSNPAPRVPIVLMVLSQLNEPPIILISRYITKGCTLQSQTKVGDIQAHG